MKRIDRIQQFVEKIWDWYAHNKRDLPWRDLDVQSDDERAYQILVSEVMLQQTQVARVKIVFKRFLEEFPTMHDLAQASNKEVIMAWRGMGYNSRALRLRDAVREIVSSSKAVSCPPGRSRTGPVRTGELRAESFFPSEMKELMALPGVGHYTAAAVRNFAFGIPTPCIETNIRRVLHTQFVGPPNTDGSWKKDDAWLLALASEVLDIAIQSKPVTSNQLPVTRCVAADWHHALMDYGSLVVPKIKRMRGMRGGENEKREPGRFVGTKYVPNRIFRGKIVEELRDTPQGLTPAEIGKRVCIDWERTVHEQWLLTLLTKLQKDRMIEQSGKRFQLSR